MAIFLYLMFISFSYPFFFVLANFLFIFFVLSFFLYFHLFFYSFLFGFIIFYVLSFSIHFFFVLSIFLCFIYFSIHFLLVLSFFLCFYLFFYSFLFCFIPISMRMTLSDSFIIKLSDGIFLWMNKRWMTKYKILLFKNMKKTKIHPIF